MFEQYLGISSDYIILGLAALVLVLIIVTIINIVQMSKLKKNYRAFMSGKNGKSLENTLIQRLDQIDELIEHNALNERNIDTIFKKMKFTFQKYGIVKYNALQELGGDLSFALVLLDEKKDGFVINSIHNREGCYIYIKEIIDGNPIMTLSEEEEQALTQALER